MAIASCTPKALLEFKKELNGLSDSDLRKVIIVGLAAASTYSLPSAAPQLISDSACYACLSDHQLLVALASIFLQSSASTLTMNQIQDRLKCLACATPKQIEAATVYLTCRVSR